MQATRRNRHHPRLLGVGLGLVGGVANIWILARWWPAPSSARCEPAIPFWNYTNTLGLFTTVLVLSVLGMVLALCMLKTPRLPSLLLIVAGGLVTIVSFAAVLLWAFPSVCLAPGGVVQLCGGALGLAGLGPEHGQK